MPIEAAIILVTVALFLAFLVTAILCGLRIPEIAVNWRYYASAKKGRLFSLLLTFLLLLASMRFLVQSCAP